MNAPTPTNTAAPVIKDAKKIILSGAAQTLLAQYTALPNNGKLTPEHRDIIIQLLALHTFREVVFLTGVKRGTIYDITNQNKAKYEAIKPLNRISKRRNAEKGISEEVKNLISPSTTEKTITYLQDGKPVQPDPNPTTISITDDSNNLLAAAFRQKKVQDEAYQKAQVEIALQHAANSDTLTETSAPIFKKKLNAHLLPGDPNDIIHIPTTPDAIMRSRPVIVNSQRVFRTARRLTADTEFTMTTPKGVINFQTIGWIDQRDVGTGCLNLILAVSHEAVNLRPAWIGSGIDPKEYKLIPLPKEVYKNTILENRPDDQTAFEIYDRYQLHVVGYYMIPSILVTKDYLVCESSYY